MTRCPLAGAQISPAKPPRPVCSCCSASPALRRSELVALQVEDVAHAAGGLRLRIPCSKTDPDGAGAEIGLTRGAHVETCPVRAFEAWQAVARRIGGPLFCRISWGGGIGTAALHPEAVRRILASRCHPDGNVPRHPIQPCGVPIIGCGEVFVFSGFANSCVGVLWCRRTYQGHLWQSINVLEFNEPE